MSCPKWSPIPRSALCSRLLFATNLLSHIVSHFDRFDPFASIFRFCVPTRSHRSIVWDAAGTLGSGIDVAPLHTAVHRKSIRFPLATEARGSLEASQKVHSLAARFVRRARPLSAIIFVVRPLNFGLPRASPGFFRSLSGTAGLPRN